MVVELSKVYDPHKVESKWYEKWLKSNYFEAKGDEREKFSIVIPPPNVTGSLHMGHALDNTLQDVLTRYKRMKNYDTLWMPGTDHAGIATQTVVEAHLAEEGLSKNDLGREKFLEKVWEWKEDYHERIRGQLQRLGVSCDWSRERFTMDEGCNKAVREVFVSLYEKGLIYQGSYIINWCPKCSTALSDIEVEHEDKEGDLTHIKYPLMDGSEEVVVATTRVETMLGDTAVAVHPEDERYKHLKGKKILLPVIEREIPVIFDEYVDPEFGSGAVKVTPAHDPNDFEMGLRHDLEMVHVITKDGSMSSMAGKYAGKDRFECRAELKEELREKGYLEELEDYMHAVGQCQRCDTVIEPLQSTQWFVKMDPLAKPAIEAVENGQTVFVPDRFKKIYLNWMENVRDWCISRQLWWGHRIPAWYCDDCGETVVSRQEPEDCPECNSSRLEQDPDVLDTWFSSALWPFSTMGWPEETQDLKKFYPTDVLVTGYDIIFFWVARMICCGLEFMDEVPFDKVLIHGLVRDAYGRKMSKSLGNGVDPLDVINEYGADTLRFTLISGNTPGNDMRFSYENVQANRNFANKIWNASRFVFMNLEGFEHEEIHPKDENLTLADRWILNQTGEVIEKVTDLVDKFELGEAAQELYEFIWTQFCDWYIELAKIKLNEGSKAERILTQNVLVKVLDDLLKLLHPFMPFISEEIWQKLPTEGESLVISTWPHKDKGFEDNISRERMEQLMEAIRSIRNLRRELNLSPAQDSPVKIFATGDETYDNIKNGTVYLENLAGAKPVEISKELEEKPQKALSAVVKGAEIFMPLEGLVDLDEEIDRLGKQYNELLKEVEMVDKKLANSNFIEKAPPEVVQKERNKGKDYKERLEKVKERLENLKAMK